MTTTLHLPLDGTVLPTTATPAAGWVGADPWDLVLLDDTAHVVARELVYRLNVLTAETPDLRVIHHSDDPRWAQRAADLIGLRPPAQWAAPLPRFDDRWVPVVLVDPDGARTFQVDPALGLTPTHLAVFERALGFEREWTWSRG